MYRTVFLPRSDVGPVLRLAFLRLALVCLWLVTARLSLASMHWAPPVDGDWYAINGSRTPRPYPDTVAAPGLLAPHRLALGG